MSRFRWLELGREEKKTPAPASKQYDAAHYLEKAGENFALGDFEAALRFFSRVLEKERLSEPAWLGQVRCLLEMGEFKEALTWADRALKLFQGSGRLMAARAVALGRMGELDRALAASDASLKASADTDWLVWWARGDVLISENAETADACFRKAREAAEDKLDLALCIAKSYLSAGSHAMARDVLESARQEQNASAQLWYFLGLCSEQMGELEIAGDAYKRALRLRRHYPEARKALDGLARKGILDRIAAGVKKIFSGK